MSTSEQARAREHTKAGFAGQLSPAVIIIRMAQDISGASPIAARIMAVLFGAASLIFGGLEWRWDIQPTLQWIDAHGSTFLTSLIAIYGPGLGTFLVVATPFLTKSALARWADKFWILGAAVFSAELFDIVTNWAGAWEPFASWPQPVFRENAVEWLKYWGLFTAWLITCTSIFQIVFAACLACFVVSLWHAFGPILRILVLLIVFVGAVLWIWG